MRSYLPLGETKGEAELDLYLLATDTPILNES